MFVVVVAVVAFAVLVGNVLLVSSAPPSFSSSSFVHRNRRIYLFARVATSPGFSLRPGAGLKDSLRSWWTAGAPTCAPKACLERISSAVQAAYKQRTSSDNDDDEIAACTLLGG